MENRPIFDPYMSNSNENQNNIKNNNQNNFSSFKINTNQIPNFPNINEIPDIENGITSATKFYEEQYMYYKYLTQVLDYKIKLMDYERLSFADRNSKNIQNNTK